MIDVLELRERAREWSLREDVVEKDYVLGWLLWGIASEPALTDTWVFKGGTCLKKCYFETYRFSEDLDFTLVEGAPAEPDALRAIFARIAERIYEAAGIEIPREQVRFQAYQTPRGGHAIEGRVYYRGPRRPGGDLPRVKIDLTPTRCSRMIRSAARSRTPTAMDCPPAPSRSVTASPSFSARSSARSPSAACPATSTTWSASSVEPRPGARPTSSATS